ncbi:MAG: helix-turn-helix domain-containing protein [Gammaproteobacteria bacterium]|nr:helix-turn-helix domain-containing protein [Gammaproteobacteria bacterium]MCY4200699.1 helix-turn-helix domain-containing protein [Gammaproteobacteria bacterium]MCY4277865.1 helix-turn-helix domain-containing protein [Gammaproteobacteria bacterium]MCY4322365.1 helix-turn-helix domain-containing protein [Gammaproteobacteria bacterium]
MNDRAKQAGSKKLDEPPPQSAIERAAAAFRVARLGAELTQDQVADALKITRERVMRLESARVSDLPPLIFIKGYMREFERLLDLEPRSIEQLFIEAYEEARPSSKAGLKPVRSAEFTSAGQKLSMFLRANPGRILTAVLLVALAGIASAAWWYFS